MATQAQLKAVQELYVAYLGRAADSAGQTFWANAIANGTATIKSVATGFTLSAEYTAAYAGLTTAALVDKIYTNILGRPSDAAGKAFWVDALAKGTVTADTLAATMVTNLGALDQATINNKVFVAQTYTDTVGADYNPEAGAAVLVGVDSTPASVTAALAAITAGTLPGQVAGLGLISAFHAAVAAETAYETADKANVDALAAKLGVAIVADYDTQLNNVVQAATDARTAIATGKSTTLLIAEAKDASDDVAAQLKAFTGTDKTAATDYQAAVAANAALTAAVASDVAAAKAGLNADTGFAAALAAVTVDHPSVTTVELLYSFYTDADTTAADRAGIDTDFAAQTKFAAFKTVATVDIAKNVAIAAEETAKGNIDDIDSGDFSDAVALASTTQATVVEAQAADANKAAAEALQASDDAVELVTENAFDALGEYNATHETSQIKFLGGVVPAAEADVNDTFFFPVKAAATYDITIGGAAASTQFGAGDSIVLGSAYTHNSGALTTGNNNALEFFLVKSDAGVQIVLETTNFGSSSVAANATTGVIGAVAGVTDAANVITLTGVTIDQVVVNNGVVSYVA